MSKKPNIVFVLTDDQGFWALGCNGNNEIITPNIDKLAEEGARFENFFCASPVCSPARATLLTGRMPSQHGIHDWIREGNVGKDAIEYLQGMRGYTEDLIDNGYRCALSGKWHLGASEIPQKGFEGWYAHQFGGGNYYGAPMIRDGVRYNEEEYVTYAITNQALNFMDEFAKTDDPFYLGVHYTAPHSPWTNGNHPEELTSLYDNCEFKSLPREELHPWAIFSTAKDGPRPENAKDPHDSFVGYYASVTGVDQGVGKIREKLKEMGEEDNTIIIFTADNGFNLGHHGIWGKGNGTFPMNMYDTSVKVPFILWYPNAISPKVVESMVSSYDFMPTLLDCVGIDYTPQIPLPGKSFYSILKDGDKDESEELVVIYDEYGPVRMIRSYTDKYVYRYPYGPDEYYRLDTDPEELKNEIANPEYSERIVFLKKELETWFMKYTDPNMDGRLERVSGNGQLCRAGTGAQGKQNYEPLGYTIKTDV